MNKSSQSLSGSYHNNRVVSIFPTQQLIIMRLELPVSSFKLTGIEINYKNTIG